MTIYVIMSYPAEAGSRVCGLQSGLLAGNLPMAAQVCMVRIETPFTVSPPPP